MYLMNDAANTADLLASLVIFASVRPPAEEPDAAYVARQIDDAAELEAGRRD